MHPTAYLLVKARTSDEYDQCDFIVIHLSTQWQQTMRQRLQVLKQFWYDSDFHALHYWGSPEGYYYDMDETVMPLLNPGEDWTYLTIEPQQLTQLQALPDPLDTDQLVMYATGSAHYRCYGKHSGEQYWSENFDLCQLLGIGDYG